MSIRVTMSQTRLGEAGTLLNSGSTYTVSDDFGTWLIGRGFATDTDALLPAASQEQSRIAVSPTRLAALVAAGELVVDTVYVVGTDWFRATSPNTYVSVGAGTGSTASDTGNISGGTTLDAATVYYHDKWVVSFGGVVTLAADLATSGRMLAFVPAEGAPDFTIAIAAGVTVRQEAGTTLLSAEAVGRTVIVLFQEDGKARVLSGVSKNTYRRPLLKKWAVKLGAALAGNANARIGIVGDSTSAGLLTGNTGKAAQSPSATMARVLSRSGILVNHNSAFGTPTRIAGATLTNYDPRWTTTGPWATLSSVASLGGDAFLNSTTTDTLTFTPRDPVTGALYAFDTVDIYTVNNAGYGTWTVNVDGGATIATVNNAATPRALRKTTISCAAGTHAINIQRNGTGGAVIVLGVCPSLSTAKGVEIYNVAAGSFTSTEIAGTAGTDFLFAPALSQLALDLTIIDIGINDRRLANYTSAFATNLQKTVTIAKSMGDCILCIPVPSQLAYSAFTTQANQDAYDAAIRDIARANDCLIYDKRALFGTYETSNALGFYSDTLHPSAGGYGFIGGKLADVIFE